MTHTASAARAVQALRVAFRAIWCTWTSSAVRASGARGTPSPATDAGTRTRAAASCSPTRTPPPSLSPDDGTRVGHGSALRHYTAALTTSQGQDASGSLLIARGHDGRVCAFLHGPGPISNNLARSSWRTPQFTALPLARTDHGDRSRTGVFLVLDRNCRWPFSRVRARAPRTGPMTGAKHRRLAKPPSSVLAVSEHLQQSLADRRARLDRGVRVGGALEREALADDRLQRAGQRAQRRLAQRRR